MRVKDKRVIQNAIERAFLYANDTQKLAFYFLAIMPAEKLDTAAHLLGNLEQGNEIYQISDEAWNTISTVPVAVQQFYDQCVELKKDPLLRAGVDRCVNLLAYLLQEEKKINEKSG